MSSNGLCEYEYMRMKIDQLEEDKIDLKDKIY